MAPFSGLSHGLMISDRNHLNSNSKYPRHFIKSTFGERRRSAHRQQPSNERTFDSEKMRWLSLKLFLSFSLLVFLSRVDETACALASVAAAPSGLRRLHALTKLNRIASKAAAKSKRSISIQRVFEAFATKTSLSSVFLSARAHPRNTNVFICRRRVA